MVFCEMAPPHDALVRWFDLSDRDSAWFANPRRGQLPLPKESVAPRAIAAMPLPLVNARGTKPYRFVIRSGVRSTTTHRKRTRWIGLSPSAFTTAFGRSDSSDGRNSLSTYRMKTDMIRRGVIRP